MIPFNDIKQIKWFFISFFLTAILSLIVFVKVTKNRKISYENMETQRTYQGVLKNVTPYQSVTYIETYDQKKIKINFARNYNYQKVDLNEFLQKGDSIVKKERTDTLYIYRANKQYYFILGKIINDSSPDHRSIQK